MIISATCQGCGVTFEARRASAKWCSDRCRKAAAVAKAEPTPEAEPAASGLVASVESELSTANVAGTFAGQLALTLARRLSHPDETGISSLSKELRTVMAAALEGVTPPAAEEDSDEVAQARSARERKAREAASRA